MYGQNPDSLKWAKREEYRQNHKPALASLLSIVVPGAGQISMLTNSPECRPMPLKITGESKVHCFSIMLFIF